MNQTQYDSIRAKARQSIEEHEVREFDSADALMEAIDAEAKEPVEDQ